MKSLNVNYKERVINRIKQNKFMHHIGFSINQIEEGIVSGDIHMKNELSQQDGFLHGGVTSSLCDIVAGFAAYTLIKKNQRVMTAEIKVSYYKPGKGSKFIAIGKVVKAGAKILFCTAQIFDIENLSKPITEATTTMAVIEDS